MACHTSGRLRMRAVKWWSSSNFPHHNIEIAIDVDDGIPWAIAHVKCKDRDGAHRDERRYGDFKSPTGESIYGGNIWSGAARDPLIAEALRHASRAPSATATATAGVGDVWL